MHPMMNQFKKYKTVMCPNCGFVQSTYANNIFKCFKCKKIREFIAKPSRNSPTSLNIKILFDSDNPNEVSRFTKRYKNAKNPE